MNIFDYLKLLKEHEAYLYLYYRGEQGDTIKQIIIRTDNELLRADITSAHINNNILELVTVIQAFGEGSYYHKERNTFFGGYDYNSLFLDLKVENISLVDEDDKFVNLSYYDERIHITITIVK